MRSYCCVIGFQGIATFYVLGEFTFIIPYIPLSCLHHVTTEPRQPTPYPPSPPYYRSYSTTEICSGRKCWTEGQVIHLEGTPDKGTLGFHGCDPNGWLGSPISFLHRVRAILGPFPWCTGSLEAPQAPLPLSLYPNHGWLQQEQNRTSSSFVWATSGPF